jgi:hypothetical protein
LAPGNPDPDHHSAGAARPLTGRATKPDVVTRRHEFDPSPIQVAMKEKNMGFGRGLLLWILGIPLPIILLLALFWR